MTPNQFHYLVNHIKSKIRKKNTNWRKYIDVEMRLAITLRFLETG